MTGTPLWLGVPSGSHHRLFPHHRRTVIAVKGPLREMHVHPPAKKDQSCDRHGGSKVNFPIDVFVKTEDICLPY